MRNSCFSCFSCLIITSLFVCANSISRVPLFASPLVGPHNYNTLPSYQNTQINKRQRKHDSINNAPLLKHIIWFSMIVKPY